MKKRCPICKRQVLTIQGEYLFVDSYWINPQLELEIPPTGYLHSHCLTHTMWGTYWFERQKSHYLNHPSYIARDLAEEGMLFKSNRKRLDSIFLKPNGVVVELSLPIENIRQWKEGITVNKSAKFSFHAEDDSIKSYLTGHDEIPLQDLVLKLGLSDLYDNPEILSLGVIQGKDWNFWEEEYHATLNQWVPLPLNAGAIILS